MRPLLEWQQEALDQYRRAVSPARFLCSAFPGMGKTELGAAILEYTGRFGIVLVPQADSVTSWRKTLHGRGICPAARIDKDGYSRTCASCGKPTKAIVLTYDGAAAKPNLICSAYSANGSALLICDEVHHLRAQGAWCAPIISARPYVDSVLALSATPFRTDESPVPFVHTEGPWTRDISLLPDHCTADYGYGNALSMEPPPVNRVVMEHFDADVTWLEAESEDGPGVEKKASLSNEKNTKAVERKARRFAVDARGDWLPLVVRKADDQLEFIRDTDRRAGGIILCRNTDTAVYTADLLVEATSGPVTVYTEQYQTMRHVKGHGRIDPNTGARIGSESGKVLDSYRDGDGKWIVTVRKISEGVDVPRLRVMVYATVTRTKLFFIQALGRIIRQVFELPEDVDQHAWMYIPDDKLLRLFAAEVENDIADAEIAAIDEDDDVCGGGDGGQQPDRKNWDRFVSSEPEYTGATSGGHMHDPELAELARQLPGSPTDVLAMLRACRSRGWLTVPGIVEEPVTLFDSVSIDPANELVSAIQKKTKAVNSWAAQRFQSGEFREFSHSFKACHSELGDSFGVWKENKDVTVDQVLKATKYARERIQDLRRG